MQFILNLAVLSKNVLLLGIQRVNISYIRGRPQRIQVDHGSAFISKALDQVDLQSQSRAGLLPVRQTHGSIAHRIAQRQLPGCMPERGRTLAP